MVINNKIIKQFLEENYNIYDCQIEDLNGHIDQVYKILTLSKTYVLKVSLNKKMSRVLLEAQVKYINYLSKKGYKSPSIIRNNNCNEISVINYYKIRNSILFDYVENLHEINITDKNEAIKLGKYLGEIHKLSLKYKGEVIWYYEPIYEEVRKLKDLKEYVKDSNKDFLLSLLNIKKENIKKYNNLKTKLRSAFLLNDINNTNVFYEEKKYIFVDWNISGKGYLVDELSWVLSWFFIIPQKEKYIKDFLAEYLKYIKLNESELSVLSFLPINYSFTMWNNFETCNEIKEFDKLLSRVKQIESLLK